jgi:hypothetical protein
MHANILPNIEDVWARGARRAMVALALSLLAAPAGADSLQIVGYSGFLGEWELTATLKEDDAAQAKNYSGPLTMKHVGLCTQDGPEQKNGKMRIQMVPSTPRVEATLWMDGVECGYQGTLSNFYSGTMKCSGQEAVPLKLWIDEVK